MRAISRTSQIRQNPLTSLGSTEPPTFPAPVGQSICCVLKKAPGGSADFSEWSRTDELPWGVSQSSTFWESDSGSPDVPEWGMFPSLGGDGLDRSSYPISEVRGSTAPPDLFQTRGSGFPCEMYEDESL